MLMTENDTTLSEHDFRRISNLMQECYGINLHQGKRELVRARLAKRLRMSGISSFKVYIERVLGDPNGTEFVQLVDSLTTNLTSFFREDGHFKYLREHFLPNVLARKTKFGKIRVWSAGCSSGEEPYSLGITLLEAIEGAGSWDVCILASDISTRVLKMAQSGIYPARRLEPLNPQQRNRFLTKDTNDTYRVTESLRSLIRFRYLNLMEPWPFSGPFDFIFCRNVMIYFDKPTQAKLVERFADVLAPGSLLFLGHSESLAGVRNSFRYVRPTIYEKP